MTLNSGPLTSLCNATTLASILPSSPPRDFKNTIHERRSIQSLVDSSKKPPYTRVDAILTKFFPDEYSEGFYGMEIGDIPGRPAFLQKLDLNTIDERCNLILRTDHPNLLNLLDISVCGDKLFLHYERPGISLERIQNYSILDRVAVATICKKLLYGLIYIHEALNVSHGQLHCGVIYLSDEGEIKIGGIGKSITQRGKTTDFSSDIQAVFQIASQLLSLDSSRDTNSMSWIIAKNFITMPSTVDPRTLLGHPFLKLSQDSWYLSSIASLLSFVRTIGLNEHSNSGPSKGDGKTTGNDMTTLSFQHH